MSEAGTPPPSDRPMEENVPIPVRILGQFVKDLSFEIPHAPEIFNILREQPPEIPITIDTSVRHLGGQGFEVTISVQLDATVAGKKAFILELLYGWVVEVNDQVVPQQHVHPLLLIEIPRQMFPFVRQIVADATANGGFPPLMLQVFDFADLYRRKFADQAAAADAATATPSIH